MSRRKRKLSTEQKKGYMWPMSMLLAGSLIAIVVVVFKVNSVPDVQADTITVYKSPTCGCCTRWVDHLEDSGFKVIVKQRTNMAPIKADFCVKPKFQSCHTATIDGYFIEGHVPAKDIQSLLEEKPTISGLSVPGMPMGSPGMEGERVDRYQVMAIDHRNISSVYSQY
jgi:hypothetical protein